MSHKLKTIDNELIQSKIFTIRDLPVMLDSDLAKMYGVENKRLNEQVKRNIERFPEKFCFQLAEKELQSLILHDSLRSQFATLKSGRGKHRKYLPYAFSEQGVSMLSAVLRSDTAIKVSIQIMDAFVNMRKFIANNAGIFQRLDKVEIKQSEADQKFEQIFNALEDKSLKPKQGIFYDGQIFDAYLFVTDLIKTATTSLVLIDNYIDESVLQLLTKYSESVEVAIYTKNITKTFKQDLKKYNSQYPSIMVKTFNKAHDRFIILDKKTVYHFGASLKDLGKKWFAFSRMEMRAEEILSRLEDE